MTAPSVNGRVGSLHALNIRLAHKSNLQQCDAEDVIQDVFRRVSSSLETFQYGGANDSFRGWLWTITRNTIRTQIKKQTDQLAEAEGGTRAMNHIAMTPDWLDEEDAAEPELDPNEESAMLRRALELVENDFAEHIWQAFWRFLIDGESAKEIANDLGINAAEVRQAKFRVLARLREVLG